MKILSLKDRVRLTAKTDLGEVKVTLKPLSSSQKIELASKTKMIKGEEVQDFSQQAILAIKFCVFEVEGFKHHDDSQFELEYENGVLTDDCADDLLSAFQEANLLIPIYSCANKNLKVEGVEVEVNPKN
jgi:hypothetical protein